jgi:hypothetical protein
VSAFEGDLQPRNSGGGEPHRVADAVTCGENGSGKFRVDVSGRHVGFLVVSRLPVGSAPVGRLTLVGWGFLRRLGIGCVRLRFARFGVGRCHVIRRLDGPIYAALELRAAAAVRRKKSATRTRAGSIRSTIAQGILILLRP